MSRLAQVLKSRRESRRTRRELNQAFGTAPTSGMRDELMMVGQRTDMIR